MNERIKLLAEQATTIEYGIDNGFDRVTFDKEKFAELIVREFVGILKEEIKLVEEFKSTAVKADVIKCHESKIWHFYKLIDKSKKHFGVEE